MNLHLYLIKSLLKVATVITFIIWDQVYIHFPAIQDRSLQFLDINLFFASIVSESLTHECGSSPAVGYAYRWNRSYDQVRIHDNNTQHHAEYYSLCIWCTVSFACIFSFHSRLWLDIYKDYAHDHNNHTRFEKTFLWMAETDPKSIQVLLQHLYF